MPKYVNMADINSIAEALRAAHPSSTQMDGDQTVSIIEHLFFAYRDFVGEPDAILAELGFGRAHHRVLHFVYRNPGMTVAVLLEILQITKQSLARVLKALIETGYIEQHTGADDRRQRLLYTTDKGAALAQKLIAIQSSRIEGALQALPEGERAQVQLFLRALMNEPRTPLEQLESKSKSG